MLQEERKRKRKRKRSDFLFFFFSFFNFFIDFFSFLVHRILNGQGLAQRCLQWWCWRSAISLEEPSRTWCQLGDSSQKTGLHLASSFGHHEVVKLLLAHPAINVNAQDWQESTPLSLACSYNSVEVVQVLLKDSRVDVIVEGDNEPPLWVASWGGPLK